MAHYMEIFSPVNRAEISSRLLSIVLVKLAFYATSACFFIKIMLKLCLFFLNYAFHKIFLKGRNSMLTLFLYIAFIRK